MRSWFRTLSTSVVLLTLSLGNVFAADLQVFAERGRRGLLMVSVVNVSDDPNSVFKIDTVWVNRRDDDGCRIGLYNEVIYTKATANAYGIGDENKTPFILRLGDQIRLPVQQCGGIIRFVSIEIEDEWYEYEFPVE